MPSLLLGPKIISSLFWVKPAELSSLLKALWASTFHGPASSARGTFTRLTPHAGIDSGSTVFSCLAPPPPALHGDPLDTLTDLLRNIDQLEPD